MHTTFAALAEPNRFQIVELLRQGPQHVGEINRRLEMSQPQVSKHLRVLRDAGLVTAQKDAQRRVYSLAPRPFKQIEDWVTAHRREWATRLDALEDHLDRM